MVPTVSLTKARMSTSISYWNTSPRGHQWMGRRHYPFIFPHTGSKSSEGDWLRQSLHPTRWACLEDARLLSRLRGLVEEQLGAEEGNPCSCFMAQSLCAMEIWETAHQDTGPCSKDPEEKMLILGAMVIPGENAKVLTSGDTLVSVKSSLWAEPWVSRLGFPFCQVNLGCYTMVPQDLGEHFKVKWKQ